MAEHANARSTCNTRVESFYTQGITVRPVLVRVLNDYIQSMHIHQNQLNCTAIYILIAFKSSIYI